MVLILDSWGRTLTVPSHSDLQTPRQIRSPTRDQEHASCSSHPDVDNRTHFNCPTRQAFYNLAAEGPRKENVSVSIARVDGELTLKPFDNLTLTQLGLSQANVTYFTHQIKTIPLLRELDLSDNPDFIVSSFAHLGTLPVLYRLSLHGTNLSSEIWLKDVMDQAKSLQHLDISSTHLTHLNSTIFHHSMNLTTLNIADNELPTIKLDKDLLRQLTSLNLSGCGLEEVLVVQQLPGQLRSLDPVSPASIRLQYLNLQHNRLTHLPESLIAIVSANSANLNITDNLWSESCTSCSLYHLWKYASDSPHLVEGWEALQCFKHIDALSTCGWQQCPPGCSCNSHTRVVDCQHAELQVIPMVGPAEAHYLLLSNNNLKDLRGIHSPAWCNLTTLNVHNNQLTALVPQDVTGHCSCYDNELFYRNENTCFPQQLESLILSKNHLKNFYLNDCQLLYPLKKLDLSWNMLDSLGIKGCGALVQLQNLILGYNKLHNLPEADLAMYPSVSQLNLTSNHLVTLPTRITRFMPSLRTLDLSHNSLYNFSGKIKYPESPFASLIVSRLEELRLDHNNFSLINPMLELKGLRTLKKLTLSNNPWSCVCNVLKDFPARVVAQLDNNALINALLVVKCAQPYNLQGLDVIDLNYFDTECVVAASSTPNIATLVASLITLGIFIMIFYYCWKVVSRKAPHNPSNGDATQGRKYDVMVVHAYRDYELVKREVIGPLVSLGYSVAWHDTAFPPGEWICVSVEEAIRNSRRMLVVATENLVSSNWVKFEIRRGHHEELDVRGFKVTALVMNNLPRKLPRDIYTLIAERIHIVHGNSDYLKKLQAFLPNPCNKPMPDSLHSSDAELSQILEDLSKRKRQARIPLSEVFSAHIRESCVTISIDIPDPTIWSQDDCQTMLNKFTKRPEFVAPRQLHTYSTEYDRAEYCSEEEEVSQLEGFVRNINVRRTWPAAGTSNQLTTRPSAQTPTSAIQRHSSCLLGRGCQSELCEKHQQKQGNVRKDYYSSYSSFKHGAGETSLPQPSAPDPTEPVHI
ncbi:hypothetical protein Pmani_014445 [Petrolisthes manimaculis]|uniref:TIR domain-containing protein n=2 Tax=Petrolisthes manimaculis TaxID=1843537 RepID=A0AAE1PVS2_9EUCA|nr:hypothetical protein Pmani_014445 [Petrolisthes manimaculis]